MSSDHLRIRDGRTATHDAESLLKLLEDDGRMDRLSKIAHYMSGMAGAIVVAHATGAVLGAAGEPPSDHDISAAKSHQNNYGSLKFVQSDDSKHRFLALMAIAPVDGVGGATMCLFDANPHTLPQHIRAAIEEMSNCVHEGLALMQYGAIARDRFREVRIRERLMTAALDGFADYPLALLDRDGNIVTWSHAAEKRTGFTTEDVCGIPFTEFVEANDARTWLDDAQTRRVRVKAMVRRKSATSVEAFVGLDAVFDADRKLRGYALMAFTEE